MKLSFKQMQVVFAFVAGLGLTYAFYGCGDNSHPPNVDSLIFEDPVFPEKVDPPLPPDPHCHMICVRRCDESEWYCVEHEHCKKHHEKGDED